MANVTTIRSSVRSGDISGSNENRHVRYIGDRIFQYAIQHCPLLFLQGGTIAGPDGGRIKVKGLISTGFAPAKKVEWMEKDQIDKTFYLNLSENSMVISSGTIDVGVDDGSGNSVTGSVVNVGDTIYLKTVGAGGLAASKRKTFLVTAYSGDTITIKQLGSTALTTLTDNSVFEVIGSALKEGSTARVVVDKEASTLYNYMQIHRDEWSITRSNQRIALYGGEDRAELIATVAQNHVVKLERTIVFGKRAATTDASGGVVYSANGLMNIIPNIFGDGTYLTSAGVYADSSIGSPASANFSPADYSVMMAGAFTYGTQKGRKLFIGGSGWAKLWNDMLLAKSYTFQTRETAFGVRVTELVDAFGTLYYMPSGTMQEVDPNVGLILQPELIRIPYLDNTFMVSDSHSPDLDGNSGYFLTEQSLIVDGTKCHAIVGENGGYASS